MVELKKQTILIVDDVPENIDVVGGILRSEYKIKMALNGQKALTIAGSDNPPDLILLDIMMPEMDGFDVCRQLKANPTTAKIPVIFVTAKGEVVDETMGFQLGAVDYITKPVSPPIVKARVKTHLALYDQNRVLEEKVKERTAELEESKNEVITTRLEIIRRLGRAAEYKDNETGLHVMRMSHYSRLLGLTAEMTLDEADLLLNAAPMHDIGKIGIPDHILLKPGKLDDEEWDIMRKHPEIGAAIIGEHHTELLKTAKIIALTHHEKWNGKGYPHGLKGEDIPRMSRIVAIADVFDALTSERPYKKAWSVEKTTSLLEEESGIHFDPDLVPVFIEIMPEILKIKERYSEELV